MRSKLLFLFVVLLAIAGSTVVAQDEPIEGGVIRLVQPSLIQFDQVLSSDGPSYAAMSNIHGYLYRMQNYGDPFPDVAESWEWVDDTTLVFHLRQGVMFHDGNDVFPEGEGREVVADDVLYSMDRWLTLEGSTISADVSEVLESVEAIDDYTVQFNLVAPTGGWFDQTSGLSNLAIIPHEAVEFYGEDFGLNPIGAGPYEFVEYVPDDHLSLRANEDYWLGCYLDGIEYQIIPEPNSALIALEANDVDFVTNIPAPEIDRIANDENFNIYVRNSKTARMMWFPSGVEDFQDVQVREAFSRALDSDLIGIAVYGEIVSETGTVGPTNAAFPGHVDGLGEAQAYDPDLARQLLADAGWEDSDGDGVVEKDGSPMEEVLINTFNIAALDSVVEIVVTQLREVGIPAVAEVVEFGTWSDMYISGAPGSQTEERRIMLWGGCGGPGGFTLCWARSGNIPAVMGFDNEEVFTAIEQAIRTPDPDERDAILEPAISSVFGEEYWVINATPPIGSVQVARSAVMDYGISWHFDNVCTVNNNVWLNQ